jgi:hypothetical protein
MKQTKHRIVDEFVINFNKATSDEERWREVIKISDASKEDQLITIYLDNDDTFVKINNTEDDPELNQYEDWTGDFDWYVGNSLGVSIVLGDIMKLPVEDV